MKKATAFASTGFATLFATWFAAACNVGTTSLPADARIGPDSNATLPDGNAASPDALPAGAASLKITATTTPAGGNYAPRNVVVVWVEQNGTFIKTLDRHADTRTEYLLDWNAALGANDPDVVSSATRASHAAPLMFTWNLKDRAGVVVPDGVYTVRMELADRNSNSAADNNEGTFTFEKGAAAQNQAGLTNGGFTNVTLDFSPGT